MNACEHGWDPEDCAFCLEAEDRFEEALVSTKIRDFRKVLTSLGCTHVRNRSSHEIWALPDGTTLPPLVDGCGEISRNVERSFKRAFAAKGIAWPL